MVTLRSFFTSASMSLCVIAFYVMSASTATAANSVISYKTSNGATTVPQGEFYDASGNPLSVTTSTSTKLQFDGTITEIGNYAFHNCKGLTSITLPSSVSSIGYFAFSNCDALTTPVYNSTIFARLPISYSGSYSIPEGISEIASAAFRNCSKLTSVTIPSSVKTIGESAFAYCTGLTSIYVGASPATITETTFNKVDKSSCILYVASGSKSTYQATDYWKEFSSIQEYELEGNGSSEEMVSIDFDNLDSSNGSFNGTYWRLGTGTSTCSKIINVEGYSKVTIVTSSSHVSYMTVTTQLMPDDASIEASSYMATGFESGRTTLDAATTYEFEVPADANYIYLTWLTTKGANRLPDSVTLYKAEEEDTSDNEQSEDQTQEGEVVESVVSLDDLASSSGSFNGTYWRLGTGTSSCSKIIDVEGYSKVTIVTSSSHVSYMTVTNQLMPDDTSVDASSYMATGFESGRITLDAATTYVFEIPADAKYIYLTWLTTKGANRLPDSVTLYYNSTSSSNTKQRGEETGIEQIHIKDSKTTVHQVTSNSIGLAPGRYKINGVIIDVK